MIQPDVYFEAGDHETHVHVKMGDFVGLLEGAQHLAFTAPIWFFAKGIEEKD